MNSEDVWSKALPSLRSINDTFCLHKTNAVWEKKIPKDLWLDYIGTKYNFPVTDTLLVKRVLNFNQPTRQVYLMNDNYFIPLKFVREDMKLKSTFFTIKSFAFSLPLASKRLNNLVCCFSSFIAFLSNVNVIFLFIPNRGED